jgi:sarcosine oxidase
MGRALDCIVLGAGAIGGAAALVLARRGAKVRLFDQYDFGHVRGSSHGPTRLLRIAYFEDPAYVPLALRSAALWWELSADAGEELFLQTGLVIAGPSTGALVPGVVRAAKEHALSLDEYSPVAARKRFPGLEFRNDDQIVFEREAGVLLADKALAAQRRALGDLGVAFHMNERILGWDRVEDRLMVRSDKGSYTTDRLVVAAGPWITPLLAGAVPVTPVEKFLFWVAQDDARFRLGGGLSPFIVETAEERLFYGFPAIDSDGVKVAEHSGGAALAAPEQRAGAPGPEEIVAIRTFLSAYAPSLPAEIGRTASCLYEMSPDGHFTIGRAPADDGVVFAAGLSGHGFKFAPVLGETLADLCYDRAPACDIGFFHPGRWNTAQA